MNEFCDYTNRIEMWVVFCVLNTQHCDFINIREHNILVPREKQICHLMLLAQAKITRNNTLSIKREKKHTKRRKGF